MRRVGDETSASPQRRRARLSSPFRSAKHATEKIFVRSATPVTGTPAFGRNPSARVRVAARVA